jgi:hypothetical protein
MVMTYMPSDAPLHNEKEYIQFRGGEFNGFQDIKKIPLLCPHLTSAEMTLTNLLLYCVENFSANLSFLGPLVFVKIFETCSL